MVYAAARNIQSKHGLPIFLGGLVLCGLYLSKLHNYLLFHTLVELFSVITAFLIFVLLWHSRHLVDNRYLTLIGISFFFIGILDLLHALAYKGMGIFPGHDVDLPTQLWIAFRYLASLSFLIAPIAATRPVSNRSIVLFYTVVTISLLWAIFTGRFPDCFDEGSGLTRFKIASEYVISLIFLASLGLLYPQRERFDKRVFTMMNIAIIASVVAELCFTQYASVYGQANMIGHFFLLGSVALIYRAIVVTGIAEPASLLFRQLKMSEEKARESEERYRSLVELSPDAIAVHSDGRYAYLNPSGLKLFGAAAAEEIVGRDVLELVHPGFRERARERIQGSCGKMTAPLQESKILRLDGGELDVETVSAPITYAGKPATQAVIRDITGRKRAEREIEHLASFPRLNPNPVIEVDAGGNIIFANQATSSILQALKAGTDLTLFIPDALRERLKTLGKGSGTDVFGHEVTINDRVFMESIKISHELKVAHIYATDITARKQAEEELRRAKEGLEQRVQERTADLENTVNALHDEIGNRMKAERELRRTKDQLENTLESIRDAFFTLDHEWRFTYVNTETTRLFRRDRDRLIGRTFLEIFPREGGTIFQHQLDKVMKERVPVVFDSLSPFLGIWVEVRAYPLEDGLSIYVHDITERKETERRIRVTNDLLKLFARKSSLKDYLDAAVEQIRAWSGCRNAGVRVADDAGRIPYVSSEGFSAPFLKSEDMLHIGSDQCACTRVIAGRQEPQDLSLATPTGSLCSNDFIKFVSGLTEEQRSRFRGVCARSGFRTVGVVPIRYRGKIIGAIHLADEREGMLPPENVEFVERMAFIIGEAVYRFGIEEELRKNYEALGKSETRYRSLVEDVRDIIFTVEPDGSIASLSPAFESITGFSTEEWIGKHFSALVHPDDAPFALDTFTRIMNREALPLFEFRCRTRSNGYRYFEFKISRVGPDAGTVLGIARDITERKLAEEDRARLVSAVESAGEAVVITAPSTGVIQYVNPAFEQMTGYTKEEALGRTLHFLESGRHDDVYYAGLRERLKEEGVWSGKLINRRKDGTQYFEDCTVSPVRNGAGEIINYVYLKRDVTDKTRLESIAQSVNTMNNIGYVFSGISHEIGNPVSSLLVNLEVMKEALDSPKETLSTYIDRALSQIAKIEYLLSSLRSFNMFEEQELQNVNIPSFIDQFLCLVTEDFIKKGITIERRLDAAAGSAYADPRALQQVLLNIFTNAADALENRASPKILVGTSRNAGYIRIRIEDNGIGMTAEQQQRLFKPFHTSKRHGTGLGMVIIKNMLSKMGGTIEIESSRDAGTSVEIMIPEGINGTE